MSITSVCKSPQLVVVGATTVVKEKAMQGFLPLRNINPDSKKKKKKETSDVGQNMSAIDSV